MWDRYSGLREDELYNLTMHSGLRRDDINALNDETVKAVVWAMKKMGIKYKSKQEMIDDKVPAVIQKFWFPKKKVK
jgi:hypothetical protein